MRYDYGRCLLDHHLQTRGLSQAEFARRIGMDKRQISAYINGRKRMSLLTAVIIADALGINPRELYEFRVIDH